MTYAHVGATQACRNSTDTRTNSAPQACSESRLFTNPSIPPHFAVRLCWSVRATEQSVYGSAMSHLVFYAFFFSLRSQRRDWLCWVSFFSPPFPPNSLSMKDSGHERKAQFRLHPAMRRQITHIRFSWEAGVLIYCDLEFIPLCHALRMWRIVH